MQPVLYFLLAFGVTLIIGGGNYVLVRLAYEKVPDFVEGVSFPCALLLFLLVVPLTLLTIAVFPPLLVLLPLSALGAVADRAISAEQDTFSWHYWKLCVAVVSSLIDALLLYVIAARMGGTWWPTSWLDNSPLPVFGCFAGFLSGPIVAPLWIWGYRRLGAFFDQKSAASRQFE